MDDLAARILAAHAIQEATQQQVKEALFEGVQHQRDPNNFPEFASQQLKIVDIKGDLVPLDLNWIQRQVWRAEMILRRAKKRPWLLILKYRKGGVTTLQQALSYWTIWAQEHAECVTFAHRPKDTRKIFRMVARYWKNQPVPHRHEKTQATVMNIEFPDWDSQYNAETATASAAERGSTNKRIHLSECSFYADLATMHVALASAQTDDCAYVLESTPNGKEGAGQTFYEMWQKAVKGESPFKPLFFPWHKDSRNVLPVPPEGMGKYTDEENKLRIKHRLSLPQLNWWRNQRFMLTAMDRAAATVHQEHPSDDASCLAAGERVGTSGGLVSIEKVTVGSKSDHGIVVKKKSRGVQPTVIIETDIGYRLRCTPEHPIAIVGGAFLEAQACKGFMVKLQPPSLSLSPYDVTWSGIGESVTTMRIDRSWGRLLGYFMGDGSFHGTTLSVACTAKDEDVVEDVSALIAQKVGKPASRTIGGGTEVRIAGKVLQDLFVTMDIVTTRWNETHRHTEYKRNTKVPECIWRSPREVVVEFLRGLFEADGWVHESGSMVKFHAKEGDFCREVQLLLLALGITSKITPTIKRLNGKEFYGHLLYLGRESAKEFIGTVGFVSRRKRERAARCNEPRKKRGRGARPNEMIATVTSVEPAGEVGVWDLQIDGEPVFSGSGLLVHNCFLHGGDSYFAAHLIGKAYEQVRDPIPIGELQNDYSDWCLREIEAGRLKIFEEPREDNQYLIGCDPAEGIGLDDTACEGVNRRSTEQAFTWAWNELSPDEVGQVVLTELGNTWKGSEHALPAYTVVERQNHGHTVLAAQKTAKYPNTCIHHDIDLTADSEQHAKRAGWVHRHLELTQAIGRTLRENSPVIRNQQTVESISDVTLDTSKTINTAVFGGRDRAVAIGLCAIGLLHQERIGRFGMIGGRLYDFEKGEWVDG